MGIDVLLMGGDCFGGINWIRLLMGYGGMVSIVIGGGIMGIEGSLLFRMGNEFYFCLGG